MRCLVRKLKGTLHINCSTHQTRFFLITGNQQIPNASFLAGQNEVLAAIIQKEASGKIWHKLISWGEEQAAGALAFAFVPGKPNSQLQQISGEGLPAAFWEIWRKAGEAENFSGSVSRKINQEGAFTTKEGDLFWKTHSAELVRAGIHACTICTLTDGWLIACSVQDETLTPFHCELILHVSSLGFLIPAEANGGTPSKISELFDNAIFRDLLEQAPVAIGVFTGKDLIAEFTNTAFLQIVGGKSNGFTGKSLFETVPDAKDKLLPLVLRLFETGEPLTVNEIEAKIARNGKTERCFFNAVANPVYNANHEVIGVFMLAHEVTSLLEAVRAIEESEQNTRSIIESAPFPIGVYVGREMKIQFANHSIMEVWGKGFDVTGKLYSEVLPELANQKVYEQLDHVFTTGIPFHAKNQRIDLVVDGILQPFYFNYSFTPLYNLAGEIYGVMNTAADVTALVKAYNNLEESEERARLAIEASEQGTFHYDLVNRDLMPSARMAEIFDLPHSKHRNEYLAALFPEDVHHWEEAFRTAYQTGILACDARIRRGNGSIAWIRIKGKIYFEGSRGKKLVGVVQDITEQKYFAGLLEQKVEERTKELAALNKKLRAMNDELQQFAYVASHDMQEPLRKIRIFSDILGKGIDPQNATEVSYVRKINASAERMTGLIHGLLEYSRASDARMRYEDVDLNNLVNAVLTDFELLCGQKGAEITLDNLPVIRAVPLQMNQLFYNLIGNALKFTRDGVKPIIYLGSFDLDDETRAAFADLDSNTDYVGIYIQDNGTGFDQIYAKKIFTVFQRLNEKDKFGGYGIGLALCKKVVEEHKGVISASSEPGQGSRFTVILPKRGV